MAEPIADVCLILEGTYPYVAGGVSTWTDDLLRAHPELRFHLLTLIPPGEAARARYALPGNVVGLTPITVQALPRGRRARPAHRALLAALEVPLEALLTDGGLDSLARIVALIAPHGAGLGQEILLDSEAAWELLLRMYERAFPESSFLDYFWSWRALLGGLYSVLLGPLPPARLYHTVSTGYAGLYAARAHLATRRPVLLTEHGIYTNERRIEIAMADWLYEIPLMGLGIDPERRDLKDFWIRAFEGYSRACYQASTRIITLYAGNQQFQLADGAAPGRLAIIPNGIDYPRYAAIEPDPGPRPPTIALIGRVVPIKDIKTFVRACALLREHVPALRALVMGPHDEDPDYYADCRALVERLGLGACIEFTGRVRLDEHLGRLDAICLTSISEAQPLVLLEAGAAGVPAVATDVGACREILLGRDDEDPPLGPGGALTRLADPESIALGLERLLREPEWHARCSAALRERVRRYYQAETVNRAYHTLYRELIAAPEAPDRDEVAA